jgi:predicted phage tail protein
MEQLRTIKLYGPLRPFGKEFKLAVKSPAEAIKALCVNVPGFEQFLSTAKSKGLEFAVFLGKENIGEDKLNMAGTREIRIAPIIVGSKSGGLFQTILGAVLIAAAIFLPFTSPLLLNVGIAMVAGGIMQMLSPQPSGLNQREPTENKPSYTISGAVNTTAYGNPVAIGAGLLVVGGAIISAGIYSEDIQ